MVEWKKLGEICKVQRGKRLTKNLLNENASYPVFHGGLEPLGRFHQFNREADTVMVINVGASAGTVGYSNCQFWSSDGCFCISHSELLNNKYLFYYLQTKTHFLQSQVRHAGIPTLDNLVIEKINLPILSLEEQNRIVGILDTFTDSIENLKQQIAQRRKQYEHYRDQLLDLEGKEGVEMIPLKDVADIGTGSSNTNEGLEKGKYPFYTRGKEVLRKNEYEFDETSIITAGDGVGVGKVFHFVSGKYALHQRAYRIHIKSEYINPRFIYYYMVSTFETYIKMKSFFAAVTSVRKPMIFNYPIPKCSLIMQQRIVSILDTFEASISNLEAQLAQRQKQYEYYRNQLLTFE